MAYKPQERAHTEKIEKYLISPQRSDMLRAITAYDPSTKLTPNMYHEFRAVLIGEIIYRNAQRIGVVCGMVCSEVENSKEDGGIRKAKCITQNQRLYFLISYQE